VPADNQTQINIAPVAIANDFKGFMISSPFVRAGISTFWRLLGLFYVRQHPGLIHERLAGHGRNPGLCCDYLGAYFNRIGGNESASLPVFTEELIQ
jgi:hypothetical protein